MSVAVPPRDLNAVRMDEATAYVRNEAQSMLAAVRLCKRFDAWNADVPWVLASIEYSMSRLSSFRFYDFMVNGKLPGFDHRQSLERGMGACGNYVQLALELIGKADTPIPCRSVQLYLHDEDKGLNNSHVGLEAFYEGKWHYFDPYYGVAPVAAVGHDSWEILSAEETINLFQLGRKPLPMGIGRLAYQLVSRRAGIVPLDYFQWSPADILYGASGVVNLRHAQNASELSLSHLPNFVGQALDYNGKFGDLKYVYDNGSRPVHALKCFVAAVGGDIHGGELKISVSGNEVFRTALDKLPTDRPIEVALTSPQDKVLWEVVSKRGQSCVIWKQILVEGVELPAKQAALTGLK